MSTETLVKIFNFCKEKQEEDPQPFISIIFALKEPMMLWPRIRAAIDSLNYNLDDYKIFLTFNTNGVLLNDDILYYCQNHNIDLHISLDGPKDIHDRGRVYRGNSAASSFDKVYKFLVDHPNFPYMSCMTTIHLQDLDRITEIFTFMSNLPISCWVYALNKFDPWTPETIEKLEQGIIRFINQATPQQIKRTRIHNTAAALPNLGVTNSLKFLQNGDCFIQPPTPNDGAHKGEFTSRIYLGNINENNITVPDNFLNTDFTSYEIIGKDCNPSCPLTSLCKRGTEKKIYVDDFTCLRLQHFNRMATYAKGGNMTEQEYKELRAKMPIYSAVINVTDACCLKCPYCFTSQNGRKIDLGTMKAAISFMMNDIARFPDFKGIPSVAFFGGEPMLGYEDIIKPTVEWAEEIGLVSDHKLSFSMTTNGVLLNTERLKWLREHQVNILLSIDGDRITQDSQRPRADGGSSFDLLEPLLPEIIKYFPNVTFRSAIEPYNVEHMFENYLFARKNNFLNYFVTPNVSAEWSPDDIAKAIEQLSLIGACIYRDISQGIVPLAWNELFTGFKMLFDPITDNEISFNHCGIGTNTMGVSVNGDINGCQEHNTYIEHDIFHIGNIFTGLDPIKHRRLLSEFKKEKHPVCKEIPELCETCSFHKECSSHYCPSHNLTRGVSAVENSLVTCMWKRGVKDIAEALLSQTVEDKNEKMIKFLEKQLAGGSDYSIWQEVN